MSMLLPLPTNLIHLQQIPSVPDGLILYNNQSKDLKAATQLCSRMILTGLNL